MTSVTAPRSILLPSPTRPTFEDARQRISITIEERPRIVSRPLVDAGDTSQRRNRRRSSASQGDGNSEASSMSRKPSTSKVFANLFSGRKKKSVDKVDDGPPGGTTVERRSMDRGGEIKGSLESLEGEIIQHQTLKPIHPSPIRRASESDMARNDYPKKNPMSRPRPPLLTLNTAPIITTSQNPPAARPQTRRRSSTRLVSPSLSSRPTPPTSPSLVPHAGGFTPFHVTGYQSPRSPMSAPPSTSTTTMGSSFRTSQMQFSENSVPFSLTIRQEPTLTTPYDPVSPSSVTKTMFDVQEIMETVQRGAFDPAQFEDGSDGENWVDKATRGPLIGVSTPPMTADPRMDRFAGLTDTTTMAGIPITLVHPDSTTAPEMERSDSAPPTFKVIPATPIAPADDDDGDAPGGDASTLEEDGKRKERGRRDSGPPVPVNPIRPRKLALMLDGQAGFPTDPTLSRQDDASSSFTTRHTDSLVFDAFGFSEGSDAGSPLDLVPAVRSPSIESLQRNTAPLRLAHSPRLVSPVTICHPVTSSLSMASSCQSSRALALSTSSTMATTTASMSSFDSLDTMDLEDVESALGTMLASLSTRPSLANRLTLDDPQMQDDKCKAPEMELSALGFGNGAAQRQQVPERRDYFASLDTYSQTEPFNLYDDAHDHPPRDSYTSDGEQGANDSETDSIFSDIDDLGSVSIAVVQKKTPAVFASPRTLSIGHAGVERLRQ